MIDSTFLELSFDGKNVTKQALYDHITTVAVVSYDPSEIKQQPVESKKTQDLKPVQQVSATVE